MSKKKLAAIIVACIIVVIVVIVITTRTPTYTLSISVSPSGAGSVSPSGGEYESGAQVTLTANPASGYTFDHWSGSASGNTSTITITMDSDKSLTAHFETAPIVPEVLFSDDFSDEAGVWDTFSDEDGSVFYENGWLHLVNYTIATFDTGTFAHQHFTDFILEVETTLVEGTDNNCHAVACRFKDEYNYYAFSISAEGYYFISRFIGGDQVPLTGPTPIYSTYINQGMGAVNLINIECIGSNLTLSVNGHVLASVTDATFSGGDIALVATSFEGSFTEIAFDNIIVTEPTPEEPELAIPAHFTTYTDELSLFSISYPPEWEPVLEVIEELEQATKDIISSITSDVPLEEVSFIFAAGLPTMEGFQPNVTIVVESLPGINWTHDEVVTASIEGIKAVASDYHEFSRVKTTVDNRTATIIESQSTIAGVGTYRYVQMIFLVSKTAWVVACTALPDEYSKWEDDFDAIVRSLRILK